VCNVKNEENQAENTVWWYSKALGLIPTTEHKLENKESRKMEVKNKSRIDVLKYKDKIEKDQKYRSNKLQAKVIKATETEKDRDTES
jgi:GH25 family lysozyme M1 (1,4-beta-N-acetylmuramidase)